MKSLFSDDLQADILSRSNFPRARRFSSSLRLRRALRPSFYFPLCSNQISCFCYFRVIIIPSRDEKFISRREYHRGCFHPPNCYCRFWSKARTKCHDWRWRDCRKRNADQECDCTRRLSYSRYLKLLKLLIKSNRAHVDYGLRNWLEL